MSQVHYFYTPYSVLDLQKLVEAHQSKFDELVGDSFSDDELRPFEDLLDSIAAVYVQPIIEEQSFSDFYPAQGEEAKQQFFFEACSSCLCLDHMPYFESNPFQVTYLELLLENFDDFLIDRGGVSELTFKSAYLQELKRHKNMDSLLVQYEAPKLQDVKTQKPVDPIDFLILDVYKELDRLVKSGLLMKALETMSEQGEKFKKIFFVMREEKLDASTLLRKTGLGAKEFDDTLEKLKFFCRKIL